MYLIYLFSFKLKDGMPLLAPIHFKYQLPLLISDGMPLLEPGWSTAGHFTRLNCNFLNAPNRKF